MSEQMPPPNPSDTSAPTKTKRNKIAIGLIGLIGLCCCGVLIVGSFSNPVEEGSTTIAQESIPQPTQEVENNNLLVEPDNPLPTNEPLATPVVENTTVPLPTDTPAPTDTPVPTNTPVPTVTPNPYVIKPGTHLVGTDLEPGIYLGMAGNSMLGACYWARLKDLSGNFDALIANDNSIGQFYIEIKESDFALETKCEIVLLSAVPEYTGPLPTTIGTGAYIVGRDIDAGIYKGNAGDGLLSSCYWARLKNFSGEFSSLLANDNSQGQFYVQVLESDYALATKCELTLLSALLEPSGDLPTTIPAGTYLVGRDIQAGRYRGEAGTGVLESCYWARLKDVTGSLNSIIANNNSNGQFFVEVRQSDFALSTKCTLELVE